MPQTYRSFGVFELAVLAVDTTKEDRAQAGDIITVRHPRPFIGRKEATTYIWLKVFGDEDQIRTLKLADTHGWQGKRRYCIPLYRFGQIVPGFDESQARDTARLYQPFMVYDEDDVFYHIVDLISPLDIHGLVFDKNEQRFL